MSAQETIIRTKKNNEYMKKKECVQCHKEMTESYGNEAWSAPFCNYPECPNYGLLQRGDDCDITKEEREKGIDISELIKE